MEFGEAFELFFIALFVFAGANLHVHELVKYAPLAFALVAVRSLAKWGGVFAIGTACRPAAEQSRSIGLLLIPMAGLAIGLVNTTQNLFPDAAAMGVGDRVGGSGDFRDHRPADRRLSPSKWPGRSARPVTTTPDRANCPADAQAEARDAKKNGDGHLRAPPPFAL